MPVQTPGARCEHCTATFGWEEATVLAGWRFGSGPEVDFGGGLKVDHVARCEDFRAAMTHQLRIPLKN